MKLASKRDCIIVALLLGISLLVWLLYPFFASSNERYAEVYLGNELKYRGGIGEDKFIEIGSVCIEVRDGVASFVQSNCPDQVCINTGKISVAGQSAACLPNQIFLNITAQHMEVDATT